MVKIESMKLLIVSQKYIHIILAHHAIAASELDMNPQLLRQSKRQRRCLSLKQGFGSIIAQKP